MKGLLTKFSRDALTLVEILVATGIVTIFLVLLLPTANRLILGSKVTTSLSNLRQLGQTSFLFAAENDGRFPTKTNSFGTWAEPTWSYAYPDRNFPGYGIAQKGTIFYTPLLEPGKAARSFGLNNQLQASFPTHRYLQASRPGTTALFGDVSTISMLWPEWANYRNAGRINIVYLDGHVESLQPKQVPSDKTDPFWSGIPKTDH